MTSTQAVGWQLLSDTLFVAGALGAVVVELKMHRTLAERVGAMKGGRLGDTGLRGLVVVCLLLTFLVGASVLLPAALALGEPGGMAGRPAWAARVGPWLVTAWVVNGLYCTTAVLWLTRGDAARAGWARLGAAATVALTSAIAGFHNYCWMVDTSLLSRYVGREAATGGLAVLALGCLGSARAVAADVGPGSLFDWGHLGVRAFGWAVVFVNGFLFLMWFVRTMPFTKPYLPTAAAIMAPMLVNGMLVVPYLGVRDSTEKSRGVTDILLRVMAVQVVICLATLGLARH